MYLRSLSNNCHQISPQGRRGRLLVALLLTLALLVGAGAGWELYLKDRLLTKRFGVVEPLLIYRSGQLPFNRIEAVLVNHRIAVLIDLTANEPGNLMPQAACPSSARDPPGRKLQLKERSAAERLGIEYHNFPLRGDGTGDISHYAKAIQVMHRARLKSKPVLIHCAAGSQRTGGVVAAYRLLVERRSPAEVRAELERYGWQPGKDVLLLNYLNENMRQLAEQLIEAQVIERIPSPLPRL